MDNYPPGAANDPNAPYNEIPIPYIDKEVSISESLSRSVIINTDAYNLEYEVEEEEDEKGNISTIYVPKQIFDDYDLKQAYYEENYPILTLLEELKILTEEKLANSNIEIEKKKHYKKILKSCTSWIEDDIEVCEA